MALNFPPQPQTPGTPYEAPNGVTYIWDGVKWIAAGAPGTSSNNLGNLYVIDQTIAGLNPLANVSIAGNLEVHDVYSRSAQTHTGVELGDGFTFIDPTTGSLVSGMNHSSLLNRLQLVHEGNVGLAMFANGTTKFTDIIIDRVIKDLTVSANLKANVSTVFYGNTGGYRFANPVGVMTTTALVHEINKNQIQLIHESNVGVAVNSNGSVELGNINGNLTINDTRLTVYHSNVYVDGNRVRLVNDPINSGNYVFDGSNILMPDNARLNSGGLGSHNSAEFGTVITSDESGITHSEIYMGAGTAESRAIIDDQSRGLMYLGVENVGEGRFAGVVARDPNTDGSQYSPGLDMSGLPTIGPGSDLYTTAVGVMNSGFTINGLFADEDKVLLANDTHVWKLDQTGDMFVPGQIRNVSNNRAVWDNEVPRDIADLTDNSMLLTTNIPLDEINIDGGGASVLYVGSLAFADGGFSGSRFGSGSTGFDGGFGAGGGYSNTLNGGGA